MGAILEMPASAAPFTTEVRSESFYVLSSHDNLVMRGRHGDEQARFSLRREHVDPFTMALAMAHEHPNYRRWADENYARVAAGPGGEWTVTAQDDHVVISGPVILFCDEDGQEHDIQSVELCYEDLPHLRQVLAQV